MSRDRYKPSNMQKLYIDSKVDGRKRFKCRSKKDNTVPIGQSNIIAQREQDQVTKEIEDGSFDFYRKFQEEGKLLDRKERLKKCEEDLTYQVAQCDARFTSIDQDRISAIKRSKEIKLAIREMKNRTFKLKALVILYKNYLKQLKEMCKQYKPFVDYMKKCADRLYFREPGDVYKRHQTLVHNLKEITADHNRAKEELIELKREEKHLKIVREKNQLKGAGQLLALQEKLQNLQQANSNEEHRIEELLAHAPRAQVIMYNYKCLTNNIHNKVRQKFRFPETEVLHEQLDAIERCLEFTEIIIETIRGWTRRKTVRRETMVPRLPQKKIVKAPVKKNKGIESYISSKADLLIPLSQNPSYSLEYKTEESIGSSPTVRGITSFLATDHTLKLTKKKNKSTVSLTKFIAADHTLKPKRKSKPLINRNENMSKKENAKAVCSEITRNMNRVQQHKEYNYLPKFEGRAKNMVELKKPSIQGVKANYTSKKIKLPPMLPQI